MEQLSHTLEVRPNLFIRAFTKFYGMDKPYDLNTCKLWWGSLGMVVLPPVLLVLSPILLVLWLFFKGCDALGLALKRAERNRRLAYHALPAEAKAAKAARKAARKSRRSEFLDKLSMTASAIWFKVQTPVTWIFRFVVGAVILAAVAFLIYLAVTNVPTWDWGSILLNLALVAGIIVAICTVMGAGILAAAWLNERAKRRAKPSVIRAMFRSIHDHTCANIRVMEPDEQVASE